jgi:hypothetical protein
VDVVEPARVARTGRSSARWKGPIGLLQLEARDQAGTQLRTFALIPDAARELTERLRTESEAAQQPRR